MKPWDIASLVMFCEGQYLPQPSRFIHTVFAFFHVTIVRPLSLSLTQMQTLAVALQFKSASVKHVHYFQDTKFYCKFLLVSKS